MKVADALKSATLKLQNAGVDSARLDATLLLEKATGKDRSFLIANSEGKLSEKQEADFSALVKKREKRIPVSQILGKKEFFGRYFKVSSDVLTPRPETEFIIETAQKYFSKSSEIKILDLGTGSGCILLTLLLEFPNSRGVGVDFSKSALAIAKANAYDLDVKNVEFINSDWCKNLGSQQKFNLIVSNPPYIPKPEKETLDKELVYEPELALFGGDDGLSCYRQIALETSGLDFDVMIVEIGINQESEVEKIFKQHGMSLKEIVKDLSQIGRVMVFTKNK